jgi:hypothetical protein
MFSSPSTSAAALPRWLTAVISSLISAVGCATALCSEVLGRFHSQPPSSQNMTSAARKKQRSSRSFTAWVAQSFDVFTFSPGGLDV